LPNNIIPITPCNNDDILDDKDIDLVLIATRHNLHGEYVLKALNAGKNVFVEKPLCIKEEDLKDIKEFYDLKLKTENSKIRNRSVPYVEGIENWNPDKRSHRKRNIIGLSISLPRLIGRPIGRS
jgi:hypothetical protein